MKKLIPFINAENELAQSVEKLALHYADEGADGLYLYNFTGDDASREEFLSTVRLIAKQLEIPFFIGVYVERFEDAKKALYTGASRLVIRKALLPEKEALSQVLARFDAKKLAIEIDMRADFQDAEGLNMFYAQGFGSVVLKHINTTKTFSDAIAGSKLDVYVRDSLMRNDLEELLSFENVLGVMTNYFEEKSLVRAKNSLREKGVSIASFTGLIPVSEWKFSPDGLIPVIVQDYRTAEVLMLAYMNKESYARTLDTGRMTYYSRSRQEIWVKGETSGHYQYVKSLMMDCDNDTILAKVRQEGAACHTGHKSCFFQELASLGDIATSDPYAVLKEDYDIIVDRRVHPKEGSYTNYLFDKGLDKILKKCGEEAAEIIIAAKNPDKEELKYEIADFLYHMMVLMVEHGLDWEDITGELRNRR